MTVTEAEQLKRKKRRIAGICVFFALAALRIGLSVLVGNWFPAAEVYDDGLMMEYASLRHHFTEPDFNSLSKFMAYPVFLNVVRYSHLPYAFFTGLLYVIAALSVRSAVRTWTKRTALADASFVYALFLPAAFELWCGTRLYRNGIIAPVTMIVLALILIVLGKAGTPEMRVKRILLPSIALGCAFTFFYYIKEDGIWMLAVLAFADAVLLVRAIVLRVKKTDRKALWRAGTAIALPLVLFAIVTGGYLAVNHRFFGVYETNTRTSGELGKFVQTVYTVSSDDRSDVIWTPNDAIEKTFSASETLKSRPEIYESLKKNPWSGGDLDEMMLKGDYLSWAIRYAVNEAYGGWNEAEVSALFHTVNSELEEAFRNGTLKKDSRVQLLPSAAGKTWQEIGETLGLVDDAFLGAVVLKRYTAGISEGAYPEEYRSFIEAAKIYSNTKYLNGEPQGRAARDLGAKAAKAVFWIYRVLNAALFLGAALALLCSIVRAAAFRKKSGRHMTGSDWVLTALTAFFLALGLAYAFSIAWFSSFLFVNTVDQKILNFYTVSLPAILTFFHAFGAALSARHISAFLKHSGKDDAADTPGQKIA